MNKIITGDPIIYNSLVVICYTYAYCECLVVNEGDQVFKTRQCRNGTESGKL